MKFSLTFRDVEFDPDSDFDSDFETFLSSFTVVKATGRIRDQYPGTRFPDDPKYNRRIYVGNVFTMNAETC